MPALLFFSQFSWAQFTQIQSGTNKKKKQLKTQFHGLWNIPLNMFYVLAWNHSESFSHRRSAVLSLKQLIHSGITKAEGLIEMFSHFSLARRRIVNHSSVVYFEISFGVWASAALFFTETSQSGWLVCFFLKATHRLTPVDLCKWNKIKFVPCIEEWHNQCNRFTHQQRFSTGGGLALFLMWAHIFELTYVGIHVSCRWMLAELCMHGAVQCINKCVFTFCQ